MPQNEYIEEAIKKEGRRLDYSERKRKREARFPHAHSTAAKETLGFKAKLLNRQNRVEKIEIRKKIKAHEEKISKTKKDLSGALPKGALPAYLLDRAGSGSAENKSKVLSNMIKEKRKDKAGKWAVPLPKVKGVAEEDVFKVIASGKRKSKNCFNINIFRGFLEANGDKSHFCWRRFHQKTTKV